MEIPGSRGSLWVDCAWSDGASLVLDLRLELGDYGDSLHQQAPGLELVPAYGEVSLNGQIVASGETLQDNAAQDMVCGHQIEPFTWAGDGALHRPVGAGPGRPGGGRYRLWGVPGDPGHGRLHRPEPAGG